MEETENLKRESRSFWTLNKEAIPPKQERRIVPTDSSVRRIFDLVNSATRKNSLCPDSSVKLIGSFRECQMRSSKAWPLSKRRSNKDMSYPREEKRLGVGCLPHSKWHSAWAGVAAVTGLANDGSRSGAASRLHYFVWRLFGVGEAWIRN